MEKARKILIADDEPMGQQLLEAVFFSEKYELHFVENGKKALDTALTLVPDLILLDVMMPEMDGFEVCKKIRNEEKTNSIPVLLITALDDRDSRMRGLESGANDYISKPFDRNEILTKVRNIFKLDSKFKTNGADNSPTEKTAYSHDMTSDLLKLMYSNVEIKSAETLKLFKDFYKVIKYNELPGTLFVVNNVGSMIYFLLINNPGETLPDSLFNLSIVQFFEQLTEKGDINNISDLMPMLSDKLNNQYLTNHSDKTNKHLTISVGILDYNNQEVSLGGINHSIVIITQNTVKIHNTRGEFHQVFNPGQVFTLTQKWTENLNLYLVTPELAEYINIYSRNKDVTLGSTEGFFSNLQNLDFARQEKYMKAFLDKIEPDLKLTNSAFVGLNI